MHNTGYKSALARRACRYSDARPPRKTDGVLLESELPPHMRGKVHHRVCAGQLVGITPAYAGKRVTYGAIRHRRWDHPRVCGEKPNRLLWEHWKQGSPPHMRGKVEVRHLVEVCLGITPAYAGKRTPCRNTSLRYWDHPRICGEKWKCVRLSAQWTGSPPHMRGKGSGSLEICPIRGITPAYAGKSPKGGFALT